MHTHSMSGVQALLFLHAVLQLKWMKRDKWYTYVNLLS